MSKREQTDGAQVRDIENGTTETIDALITDNENRYEKEECNHLNREGQWKKRYWFTAFAAIIVVISATWFTTNYVTHWYGTNLYPKTPSTVSMMAELEQHKKLIEILNERVKSKTRTSIWFDRKRQHKDLKFAIVDSKFPAGHEIWEDGRLIERWHWKIEGQPKTDQYGDYIFRCVSTYNSEGEYSGFKQYVMANYPDDDGLIMPIDNALEYTLNISQNSFRLKSYDTQMNGMEILWRNGEIIHTFLHARDFVYAKQNGTDRDLYSIIQEPEQLTYMEHLSKMFPFIATDVLEPFKKSIRYEKIKAEQLSLNKKRKTAATKSGRKKG